MHTCPLSCLFRSSPRGSIFVLFRVKVWYFQLCVSLNIFERSLKRSISVIFEAIASLGVHELQRFQQSFVLPFLNTSLMV